MSWKRFRTAWQALTVLVSCALSLGCHGMSESVRDEAVGLNGGFEHVRDGLPINWLVYTPTTVPTGDFEFMFDATDFKEGRQSMKFVIRQCSATGGWQSPGLTREIPVHPGESYAIRFWIKSEGCDYVVSAGGVDAFTGELTPVDAGLESNVSWRRIESVYRVPQRYDTLRMELSIRSPGTLWIDAVQIDRVRREPDDE